MDNEDRATRKGGDHSGNDLFYLLFTRSKVMTEQEQTQAFSHELDNLVRRFADEFDITNEAIIGVFENKKFVILMDLYGIDDED